MYNETLRQWPCGGHERSPATSPHPSPVYPSPVRTTVCRSSACHVHTAGGAIGEMLFCDCNTVSDRDGLPAPAPHSPVYILRCGRPRNLPAYIRFCNCTVPKDPVTPPLRGSRVKKKHPLSTSPKPTSTDHTKRPRQHVGGHKKPVCIAGWYVSRRCPPAPAHSAQMMPQLFPHQ